MRITANTRLQCVILLIPFLCGLRGLEQPRITIYYQSGTPEKTIILAKERVHSLEQPLMPLVLAGRAAATCPRRLSLKRAGGHRQENCCIGRLKGLDCDIQDGSKHCAAGGERMRTRRTSFLIGSTLAFALCLFVVPESVRGAADDEVDRALSVEEAAPAQGRGRPGKPQFSVESEIPFLVEALQRKAGELEAARKEIERLKELIARIGDANRRERLAMHYNMGCAYRAAGFADSAEKEFLKALELDPDDAGVHYNLGVLYEEDLKDKAAARRYYERFLELAPNDGDAGKVQTWLMMLQ